MKTVKMMNKAVKKRVEIKKVAVPMMTEKLTRCFIIKSNSK